MTRLLPLLLACQTSPSDVLALRTCADACPNGIATYKAAGCQPASCACLPDNDATEMTK